MFEKFTVFILGAGASKHYHFPTGNELKEIIRKGLSEEGRWLLEGSEQFPAFSSKIRELVTTLDRSGLAIDDHLASHPGLQEVGKYLIAKIILAKEVEENLHRDGWYVDLWQRLWPGKRALENLAGSTVAFITFNYDRSLEQSLFVKACNSYDASNRKSIAEQLKGIPIVHVHGQLGALDWQDYLDGMDQKLYESPSKPEEVFKCSQYIKIVDETAASSGEYMKAKELVEKAEIIHFLGFGYHAENLQRLRVGSLRAEKVSGTCLNLDLKRRPEVAGKSDKNQFGREIELHDMGIDEYFRSVV